jgi:hypothetical protein
MEMEIEYSYLTEPPYSIDPVGGECCTRTIEEGLLEDVKPFILEAGQVSARWCEENGVEFEDKTREVLLYLSAHLEFDSSVDPLGGNRPLDLVSCYLAYHCPQSTLAAKTELEGAQTVWDIQMELKRKVRSAVTRYRVDRVVRLGVSMDSLYRSMSQVGGLSLDDALKTAESLMEGLA